MADTRRGVSWSLERPCPLRHGQDWTLPSATRHQLLNVSLYSTTLHDICVTIMLTGLPF